MKARTIFATAALMLASLGVSTSASAQHGNNGRHDRSYQDRSYQDRGHRNHGYRNSGYDRGRHDGGRRYYGDRRWRGNNGWRHHRRCWTEFRHHRAYRICR